MPKVLVTGGAGYIGSHCCVALIEAGHEAVILDNLSNAHEGVVGRIEAITGTRPEFVQADIRDEAALDAIFASHDFDAVIHFAALKAVGESVVRPLDYFDNNVHGSVRLFSAMRRAGVRTLVFSSSATVYGDPASVPVAEDFPLGVTNPYGRSKLMVEGILEDLVQAEPGWRVARLRYFNPVGAHKSGLIGEDPRGVPDNLTPYIAQVAAGRRERLTIFGNDYPTPDGTGVRDYIHVMDLVEGHVAALAHLDRQDTLLTLNLGTGRGYSVLEMVQAFERASGRAVPYTIAARRPGDVAQCYADPSLAANMLGWRALRSLEEMCADSWRWQQNNPNG